MAHTYRPKYARLTIRALDGGTLVRTIALDHDGKVLSGYRVGRDGERSEPLEYVIVTQGDVVRRADLRVNLHYAELEEVARARSVR